MQYVIIDDNHNDNDNDNVDDDNNKKQLLNYHCKGETAEQFTNIYCPLVYLKP